MASWSLIDSSRKCELRARGKVTPQSARGSRKLRSEKFQRQQKEQSFSSHPVLTAAGKIIFTSIASVCVCARARPRAPRRSCRARLRTYHCDLLKGYAPRYFSTTSAIFFPRRKTSKHRTFREKMNDWSSPFGNRERRVRFIPANVELP